MEEIEAKIKIDDEEAFLSRLQSELLPISAPTYLHDTYFDFPQLDFKAHDNVLRLRREGDKVLIAYKGPRRQHQHLISRQEEETEIASYDVAYKIIMGIGFQPIEVVEKKRQGFKHRTLQDLKIFLDQLPFIGSYLEVEGREKQILAFLESAGLDINRAIRKNYTEIFLEFCDATNLDLSRPRLQFTFADEATLGEQRRHGSGKTPAKG